MDAEFDDFDDVLANISIPTQPKQIKLASSTLSSTSTSTSASSSSSYASNKISSAAQIQTASCSNQAGPATNIVKSKAISSTFAIIAHSKQRGNPILQAVTKCPIEFRDDILADYIVGKTTCILYLSLQYYNLHPDYICDRLKTLGKEYELRVLLVQVDIPDPFKSLKNLTRISVLADMTMMLAWNKDEAGKIIENYKLLEKKTPDWIMEKPATDPYQKIITALTNIKPINKTDAANLLQNFGTLENIINASEERLSMVSGLGPRKAKKLYKLFNTKFAK